MYCLRLLNLSDLHVFRYGSVLAISRSDISSWLLSKVDPDEFDTMNTFSARPEHDTIHRQVIYLFNAIESGT